MRKPVVAKYMCPYCRTCYPTQDEAEECAQSRGEFLPGDFVLEGKYRFNPPLHEIRRIVALDGEHKARLCVDGLARVAAYGDESVSSDSSSYVVSGLCSENLLRVSNGFIDGEVDNLRRRLAAAESLQKAIHEANARHEGGK